MVRVTLESLLVLAAAVSPAVSQAPPGPPALNQFVTGTLGNATVEEDNPPGAAFRAIFPRRQFGFSPTGSVSGIVVAQSNPGGAGTVYSIKMDNLPASGGPLLYHIHETRVPKSGNCNDTDAHLDPFQRGEVPDCDPDMPETCQVGDLAGKHGAIVTTPGSTSFATVYTDVFTSTGGGESFMGNLSIVLHYANKTRITCANFGRMDVATGIPLSLDEQLKMGDSEEFTG